MDTASYYGKLDVQSVFVTVALVIMMPKFKFLLVKIQKKCLCCQELPPRTGLSVHGDRHQALSNYAQGTRRLRGDMLKTSEVLRAVR